MDTTHTKTRTKKQKRIGVFLSVIQVFFIIALVVLAAATFGTRIPALAKLGINFFAVSSGSMEPAIPTGSLIYAGKYKLEDLKEGDVITYRKSANENDPGIVVTHRISKVEKNEETKSIDGENGQKVERKITEYSFITKGDANQESDSVPVKAGEIIGLYKWHLPQVGYVTAFTQTQQGFILLVILPAAILIIWEVTSLILHFKKEYSRKSESEIARLKAELEQHKQSHA